MAPTAPAALPADPDAPDWTRPPVGPDALRNDGLLAAALFVAGILSFTLGRVAGVYEEPAPAWAAVLCLAGVTLPLGWRRRAPSVVALGVAVVFVVLVTIRVPESLVANICLFLALYSVGAWEPRRRRATWVRVVVIAGMFVWLLLVLFRATSDPEALPDLSRVGLFSPLVAFLLIQLLTNVAYFGAAYWFGEHAWGAARQRARTELRTAQLEAERKRVAAQAVSLERLRLARELHDAVAHHVSLMGVQASAARTLLPPDAARSAEALEHVEDAARGAVRELQSLLGTLREPGNGDRDTGADAVGSLGVDRLPDLVEEARTAGLPVDLQVIGEPRPLPPLVSLNLYRITQEALTNTRKHAGARARADVRLRYLPGAVEVEVADDGLGARRRARPGGLGLVGMRERAAADGGVLVAGPRSRGGFLVRVTVPLPDAGAGRAGTAGPDTHAEVGT